VAADGGPASAGVRWAARIALALLGAVFAWRLAYQIGYCWWAIHYPYELDYGEGIVWQQLRLLFTARAYGPITGFPAIVFHYPPLYHALTAALCALFGSDPLATGRALAAAGLAAAAIFAGLAVSRALGSGSPRSDRRVGAGAAALILCGTSPVIFWLPVMRVDMLALALSFSGLWLAMLALERPALVHGAALAFVLALFTKQTMIAAPAAAFAVLLLMRPRTAVAGIATALLLGVAALGLLEWSTAGGFARHVFLYNLNRFDPAGLWLIRDGLRDNGLAIALAMLALRLRGWPLLKELGGARSLAALRTRLAADGRGPLLILLGHLTVTTLMLAMIAKSGASQNYLIEWMSAVAMFAGLALADVARIARGNGVPAPALLIAATALLALQLAAFGKSRGELLPPVPPRAESARLVAMIRAAGRPVISDNMVIVLRAGKEVLWEPAIFAELDGSRYFSAEPFVAKIRHRDFAFFVTFGRRGDAPFDARYTPAMAQAMDRAYPRLRGLAGLTLHLPPADPAR